MGAIQILKNDVAEITVVGLIFAYKEIVLLREPYSEYVYLKSYRLTISEIKKKTERKIDIFSKNMHLSSKVDKDPYLNFYRRSIVQQLYTDIIICFLFLIKFKVS